MNSSSNTSGYLSLSNSALLESQKLSQVQFTSQGQDFEDDEDFFAVFRDDYKAGVNKSDDLKTKLHSLRRRAARNQAKLCRGLIFGDDEFNIKKKFKSPTMNLLQSVSNVTKSWLSIYKRPQFYEPYMESVHKERIQLNLAFSYFMFVEQIGPISMK